MALSANMTTKTAADLNRKFQIVNAEVIYGSAYVALAHPTEHATTAARGYLNAFASETYIPLGFASSEGPTTGSTSSTPIPAATVGLDRTQKYLSAASGTFAGSRLDRGKEVWASDDGTFSLTRTSQDALVGMVMEYGDASHAWVGAFGAQDQHLLAKAGQGRFTQCLGVISAIATSAGTAQSKNYPLYTAPAHQKLVGLYSVGLVAFAGGSSGGATTLTFKIGASASATTGTAISGGTISTVIASYTPGTYLAGGTIGTTTNILHEGDNLICNFNPAQTGTAGQVQVFGIFENLPGF